MTSRHTLRLCRVVTVPFTFATLLPAQIEHIVKSGIDLTLVAGNGEEFVPFLKNPLLFSRIIPMERTPHPIRDFLSLINLIIFFKGKKFDIVHSSTPKAGLLTALAAWIVGVPIRIHTYTGQIWVEMTGPMRILMRGIDWLISKLNTHTYADSFSQRDFLVREGLVASHKIDVVANGSISGVDLERFDPTSLSGYRDQIRSDLQISRDAIVVVFVGRVTKDKGIVELLSAFQRLQISYEQLHLLLVGPFEPDRDPLPDSILTAIHSLPSIHALGMVTRPEIYLAASDIFCLPSYREGFGSVIIEAGAMNLPSIATQVTGLVDAVVEGETGILVPPKDSESLEKKLMYLIESPELRHQMGSAARKRVERFFDAKIVNQAVVDQYFRLINSQ